MLDLCRLPANDFIWNHINLHSQNKGVMLMSDKRKELIAEIKAELSDLTDEQIKRLLQLIKEEQRKSA